MTESDKHRDSVRYLYPGELDIVLIRFCPMIHEPFRQFHEPDLVFSLRNVEIGIEIIFELVGWPQSFFFRVHHTRSLAMTLAVNDTLGAEI
jgi:hypothetical protein